MNACTSTLNKSTIKFKSQLIEAEYMSRRAIEPKEKYDDYSRFQDLKKGRLHLEIFGNF